MRLTGSEATCDHKGTLMSLTIRRAEPGTAEDLQRAEMEDRDGEAVEVGWKRIPCRPCKHTRACPDFWSKLDQFR